MSDKNTKIDGIEIIEEEKIEEKYKEVKRENVKPKKKKKNRKLMSLFFTVAFAVVVGLIIVISILKFTPLLSKLESSIQNESSGKIVTNTNKNTDY